MHIRFLLFRPLHQVTGLAALALAASGFGAQPETASGIPANWRNITSGWVIPDEQYADQPYIVKCDDGAWLCVITTAGEHEGADSQHVAATRSTDFGRTWSPKRHEIPVRETAIDRENPYQGRIRFFWHVGRPLIHDGSACVTLHKVGGFGLTFIDRSEGNFLRSDNLLTERDPTKIRWETLPDGEIGLRAVEGPIAEEQSIVALSDGSFYSIFRTATDHPGHAYSRDGGHTWTAPEPMT